MPRRLLALALLLATVPLGAPLSAQQAAPERRGVIFGLDPILYSSLNSDAVTGGRSVGGLGLAMRFGWGISDTWSVVLDVAVVDLDVADTAKYVFAHGDLLLRATPVVWDSPLGPLVPVLQAGWSLRDVTAEDASPTNTAIYVFEGSALTLGAGAELYLNPKLALWFAGYWTTGEFDDERIGNITTHSRNEPGTSMRVGLGLTYHGGRKPK